MQQYAYRPFHIKNNKYLKIRFICAPYSTRAREIDYPTSISNRIYLSKSSKSILYIKNGAIYAPFFIVFCCYYASLIAPTGQPSSHAPQSMHCSGSTTYLLSPSAIAPTGQVSAHAPHWMQSSPITLGIVFSPYKIIFAFACNNISTPLCV